MSVLNRLDDSDLLWRNDRREGALLSVLIAVAATARRTLPKIKGDRACFVAFMKSTHGWTISIEHRGKQIDVDELLYTWLRCELVHSGGLPVDIKIDETFADPHSCSIRAGGAPEYTVLLSPGWYDYLVGVVRGGLMSES